jgi:hypothetical protein
LAVGELIPLRTGRAARNVFRLSAPAQRHTAGH